MTAQALERNPSGRHDQPEPMSLRTDLYLIAHDDDTGQPHLDTHTIATGLARAVLLELRHTGRVHFRLPKRNHSQTVLIDASSTGDPIHDAALILLWRLGGTVDTHQFIEQFATTDLYHQVRDHLVATGILYTTTRRRYWFIRTEIHRPADATHPVRARMRIRDVARLYRPRIQDITLALLVIALGLTPYLNLPDTSVTGVHLRLAELIGPEHPLRDITNTIRPHRIRYR